AMLNALEARARRLGYTELHLDTTVQQVPAQRLYEKNGYALVRESTLGDFHVRFYEKKLSTGTNTHEKCRARFPTTVRQLARELLGDIGRTDSDVEDLHDKSYQIIRKLTIEEERLV